MAIKGSNVAETYQIEYESIFTIDEQSAAAVSKHTDRLLNKVTAQDQRYTSIVSKLKEMAGPEGVKGYTDALAKAEAKLKEVDAQLQKIKEKQSGDGDARGLNSSARKLNRLRKEAIVLIEQANRIEKDTISEYKQQEQAQKRLVELARRRVELAQKQTTVPLSKEMEHQLAVEKEKERITKRIALEQNEELRVAKEQLALQQKITRERTQQALSGRATTALPGTGGPAAPASTPTTSGIDKGSFLHKISTTAQYGAAAAGIYAITDALREGAAAILEYDTASRTLAAVIDGLSLDSARQLEDSLIDLGKAYGGSIDEINKAAILLGRAGIAHEDLAKATEVTIKLAKLTGDSLDVSSGAMITYLEVYGKAGETVESLGNKLAFMANESRLSTLDIETFSNYALAASEAAGLTVDAVSAMATEFSKAGVNASTIGTQIRSLTKVFLDTGDGVKTFFGELGIVQANFQADLVEGGEKSNQTIVALAKQLAGLTKEEFNRITASMDILQRNSLALLRQQANGIEKDITTLVDGTHQGIAAVDTILSGHVVTWEKFKNTVADLAIEMDKAIGFSAWFAEEIEGITALMSGNLDKAYDIKEAYILIQKQQELGIALQKEQVRNASLIGEEELAKSNQIIESISNEIKANEEKIKVLKKVDLISSDPQAATKTAINDRIESLAKEREAIEQNIAKFTQAIAVGEKYGYNVDGTKKLLEKETESLAKNTAGFEKLNASLEKIDPTKQIKEQEKLVKLFNITEQDVRNLTSATVALYEAGQIGAARSSAPVQALNENIKVNQRLIENLISKNKELKGLGLDTSVTSDIELQKNRSKVYSEYVKLRQDESGLSQAEIKVINKRAAGYKALLDFIDKQVESSKQLTQLQQAELSAVDKQLKATYEAAKLSDQQEGNARKLLLDQRDKVALARVDLETAKKIADESSKLASTKKSIAQADEDKKAVSEAELALEKAITNEVYKRETSYAKFNSSIDEQLQKEAILFGNDKERSDLAAEQVRALENINMLAEENRWADSQRLDAIAKQNELYDLQKIKLSELYQASIESADLLASSLGDYMTNVAMRAEDAWTSVRDAMIKGLIDITIKLLIIEPIAKSISQALSGVGGLGGLFGGTTSSVDYSGTLSNTGDFSGMSTEYVNLTGYAQGGAFENGSRLTAYANGGIVDKPTLFPMANGRGLMGESGPEAVLPLTRLANGDLGVRTDSSSESSETNIEFTIINDTGLPVNLTETKRKKDDKGKEFVTLLMTNLNFNPDVRNAIKSL